MKKLALALIALSIPSMALAQNIGQCGWGSRLFDGERGLAPQVLAATTNGTSGNQTFAITSGTSGCTQDGVVKSSWKTAMFLDSNMNRFAMDVSRGEGEAIDSLAVILEVEESDRETFAQVLKSNFDKIFTSSEIKSEQVASNLRGVLAAHQELSAYAALV